MDPVRIEPIWQRPNVKDASVVHVTACHRAERNSSYETNGLCNGSAHRSAAFGMLRREKSQDSFRCGGPSAAVEPPTVPQRTSSVDADRLNNSLILNNGQPAKMTTELSPRLLPANRNATQSSHMQIILGQFHFLISSNFQKFLNQ